VRLKGHGTYDSHVPMNLYTNVHQLEVRGKVIVILLVQTCQICRAFLWYDPLHVPCQVPDCHKFSQNVDWKYAAIRDNDGVRPKNRCVVTRLFVILITVWGCINATVASAEDRPVLVELFTSQGCSSCPPADDLFSDLAHQPGVVALAFHVDYWDYIGWKDSFAQPLFTLRQKLYARRHSERMVYTPQVIVQGQEFMVGSKAMDIASAIKRQSHKDTGIEIRAERDGANVLISIDGTAVDPNVIPNIFVAEYEPTQTVDILLGENKGHSLTYTNIVKSISLVGTYTPPHFEKSISDMPAPVAIFVQDRDHGVVLAAQILR
jgi:hypothetical protein